MRTTSKQLPANERRAVTVEAVLELASERDPGDITTAAIAKRMNLTQGALFRHFPTKEALWEAVMEWVAGHLLERVDRAARGTDSPMGALQSVFMAHVEFVAQHPGVPRMIFGELQRAEDSPAKRVVRTLLDRYRERLWAIIEKGKAKGEIASDVDTIAAATVFIGTIQGLVMQSLLAQDVKRIRLGAPGAFAIYRRGIGGAR